MQEVLNIQHKLTKKWDNVKYWKKSDKCGRVGVRKGCLYGRVKVGWREEGLSVWSGESGLTWGRAVCMVGWEWHGFRVILNKEAKFGFLPMSCSERCLSGNFWDKIYRKFKTKKSKLFWVCLFRDWVSIYFINLNESVQTNSLWTFINSWS